MGNAAVLLAGRYALEEEIGGGGMATVWCARDEILARQVAIKVLRPHLAQDDAFLTRFRQEAVAAAGLVHPHIVSIFDTGTDGDGDGPTHYIVMEYCSNGTLARELHATGVFEPARAVQYLHTICKALGYAHERGIVHRDVKPANVLVASDGTLKVTDFGIAKAADVERDVSTTGTILGTVAYISPEQAQGGEAGARSDIYSLGVVAYELLTGTVPFNAESHVATALMHVNESPDPPSRRRAGIPAALERVVLKALEKDPDRRFATTGEMAAALEEALPTTDDTPASAERATTAIATQQKPGVGPASTLLAEVKWAIPLAVVVVVTVALVIALSVVFSEDDRDGVADDERPTAPAAGPVEVAEVTDFDPFGDGTEHADQLGRAIDGDPATLWTTERYNDPFGILKPGVGLVFDLGSAASVEAVEVVSPLPGYELEIRASDENGAEPDDFEPVTGGEGTGETAQFAFDEPVAARYWLLWITALPGGTGRAEIGEVRFIGG